MKRRKSFPGLYRNYWQTGYRTGAYECLAPEAYRESLRDCALKVETRPGAVLLDLGCGSGILLPEIQDFLEQGGRYLGLDILQSGLEEVRRRASTVHLLCADMTRGLPLKDDCVDTVLAHFSLHAVPRTVDRRNLLLEIRRVLKPGSRLICVQPSKTYDPSRIVAASLGLLWARGAWIHWLFGKYLLYPFTRALGLRHVRRQLVRGAWHAFGREELIGELSAAGLKKIQVESAYAGSAWCGVAEK